MRPNDKGWFKEYLELRKSALMDLSNPEIRKSLILSIHYIAFFSHRIMYGQSVASMGFRTLIIGMKRKAQDLIDESLIAVPCFFMITPRTEEDLAKAIVRP